MPSTIMKGSTSENTVVYQVANYTKSEDRLVHISKGKDGKMVTKAVVFDNDTKQLIFTDVHVSSRGGHIGYNNTVKKISSSFYWLGITDDVKRWIEECDPCQCNDKYKLFSEKMTSDLGHHKAILTSICRICGVYCDDLKYVSAVNGTDGFSEDVKTLGIDTANDDDSIHPSSICKTCTKAAIQKRTTGEALNVAHYEFPSHKDEDCEICKYPCGACLLVPIKSVSPRGGFLHYGVDNEEAVKERHKHLASSMLHLPAKFSQVVSKKDALALSKEQHSSPCKLCSMPCPLCGMSLKSAAKSFAIRCKLIGITKRVLRTRKRQPPIEKEEKQVTKKAKKSKPGFSRKNTIIFPKIQPSNDTACKVNSTRLITFKSYDGKTYKVPVVTNNQAETQRTGTKVAMKNSNLTIPVAPSNKFSWPVSSLRTQNVKFGSTSDRVVAGKPAPRRSIDFGTAPRVVAKAFHDLYKKHSSLTGCIRQALTMEPLLQFKYKFINPTLPSEQCILIGVLSEQDTDLEVNAELARLDTFVKDNHLESRAAAIEELLYSPLQNVGKKNFMSSLNSFDATGLFSCGSKLSNENTESIIPVDDQGVVALDKAKKNNITCLICNKSFPTPFKFNRHCESNIHIARLLVKQAQLQEQVEKGEVGESTEKSDETETNCDTQDLIETGSEDKEDDPTTADSDSNVPGSPTSTINYSDLLYKSFQSVSFASSSSLVMHTCYICNSKVSGEGNFLKHLWKHKKARSCTWCGQEFISYHYMRVHIGKKNCTKKIELSGSSKKVFRLTGKYTGIVPLHYKPYATQLNDESTAVLKCKFCSFSSEDETLMIGHARKHVGDFPYRCSQCVYGAVSETMLTFHQNATGHKGFHIIERNSPLTSAEIEKLDSMVRQNIISYNTNGDVDIPFSCAKTTKDPMIMEFDVANKKEIDNSQSSWSFCKVCNSAFLDKETFDLHASRCRDNRNGWPSKDEDKTEDEVNVNLPVKSESKEIVCIKEILPGEGETPNGNGLSSVSSILVNTSAMNARFNIQQPESNATGLSGIESTVETSQVTRNKLKQKRGRLLDVIAGLSAGNVETLDKGTTSQIQPPCEQDDARSTSPLDVDIAKEDKLEEESVTIVTKEKMTTKQATFHLE